MFIIKFNNMIRNKWIWGIFAGIIALAFAGSDFLQGGGDTQQDNSNAGKLNGEEVSFQEYQLMRNVVSFEEEYSNATFENPERETWNRLAALKTAKELGITVSDADLVQAIHADPTFQDEADNFSAQRYNMILASIGYTTAGYEQMMRTQIALSRLRKVVASASWVSPASLAERVHGYTDQFTICTSVFSNKYVATEMDVSEDELKDFFERKKENYREPDKRQVVYTVFKAADYLNEYVANEDEVVDYYDSNISEFLSTDTNGVEVAKPLEEVRQSIEEVLAKNESEAKAYRAAADFSDVFYTNKSESLTFEAAAASQGLTVLTTRLFTATGYPVHVDGSPAFRDAAFMLENDSLLYRFSDAVNGGAESYVMGFHKHVDSYIPELDKIKPRVQAAAKMEAAGNAFRADLDKVIDAFTFGNSEKKAFREIATEQGMNVSTNFSFSYMDSVMKPDVPEGRVIAQTMADMDAGAITKAPIPTADGALFFEVVDRKAGDETMFASIKTQSFGTYFNEISELSWNAWLEQNLVEQNLTNPIAPLDTEEVTDEAVE